MSGLKLSLQATRYVRQLVNRHHACLRTLGANRSSVTKTLLKQDTNLTSVLVALYEEPTKLAKQIQYVESLVSRCEELATKGARGQFLQEELEQEILKIFSLKLVKHLEPLIDGNCLDSANADTGKNISPFATIGFSQDGWGWSNYVAA